MDRIAAEYTNDEEDVNNANNFESMINITDSLIERLNQTETVSKGKLSY